MLNNPNNPTGAVLLGRRAARRSPTVMRKHPHVWIMSDDMYEHLVFDGFEHATMAQVAPDLQRPHADRHRRVEDLRDDRLAHRLRRRAEAR